MLLFKNGSLIKGELELHDADLVVNIPSVDGEQRLFAELKEKLSFPEYFGGNWNALRDMMRDFEWLPNKRIVLIHDNIPSLSMEDLKIYLDILKEAIAAHLERGVQELIVTFPEDSKERLSHLLPQ